MALCGFVSHPAHYVNACCYVVMLRALLHLSPNEVNMSWQLTNARTYLLLVFIRLYLCVIYELLVERRHLIFL